VVALVASLGGQVGRLLLVGCEPEGVDEGAELSAPVLAAVDEAVSTVRELIDEHADAASGSSVAAGGKR
jgi:hydrogenase maturation protease